MPRLFGTLRGILLLILVGAPLPAMAEAEPKRLREEPLLSGTDHPAITVEEALARFRRESLLLQAARYEVDAARADVIAAGVLSNPNLSVSGTWLLWGAATGGEREYAVSIEQEMPIGGQIGLRKEVARGLATAAERDFAALAWALAYDVRIAYVDVQAAQARHRALLAGLSELDRAANIVEQRAKLGANPQYDLVRVEVERADVRARLADIAIELADARNNLALLMGKSRAPETLVAEAAIPEAPDAVPAIDALLARALGNRPDLAAARARILAAEMRIRQVRREYVPSPLISIGYMPWYAVPDASPNRGAALLAGVTIPLPVFDRGQGQVERATAEARQAMVHAEAAEHLISLEIIRAATAMEARVSSFRSYRDKTKEQVERLRIMAEAAYREGQSSILELLDAYREHLEASEREIELRAAAWQAVLDLERAMGPAGSAE